MTPVTGVALWAFASEGITISVGLALLILIIWQAPQQRDNQLMAIYMGTVVVWGAANSLARLGVVLHSDNSFFFYLSALCIAFNSFALFTLTTHYANLWERMVIKGLLLFGCGSLLVVTPLIYQGVLLSFSPMDTGDLLGYEITPMGYAVFMLYYLYYLLATISLWRYRRQRAGTLLSGGIITCLGVLTSALPYTKDYPLDMICVAVGSFFFAQAILKEKLFNPLAELNQNLSDANRRLTEMADSLRKEEAKLTALIESTPDMVWSVDNQWCILTINTAFRQMFSLAYQIDLQPGMRILDYIPVEQRVAWQELYETTLKGERVSVEQFYSVRGIELYVDVSLTPIRTADDRITGVAVFSRDVTERHRADDLLHRQNEYMNALHETTLGLIRRLEISQLLETIIYRAAALVGTSHGYIYLLDSDENEMSLRVGIGAQTGDVGHRVQRGEGMPGRVWTSGMPLVVADYNSWPGKTQDNKTIHAAVCVPLKSESQVIGAIGLAYLEEGHVFTQTEVDILGRFAELAAVALDNARLYDTLQTELEERKRAEEAAEAANRAKSTFLANMSHELRTPLNAIIGYSEMLMEIAEDEDGESYLPDLKKIDAAAKHLLGLITDILDISKIEAGKMALESESFDLGKVIENTLASIQPMAEKNCNSLEVNCSGEPGIMFSDRAKVQQCLLNILSNAAKFTTNGKITLEVGRNDRMPSSNAFCVANSIAQVVSRVSGHSSVVVFRISDTGIGVSADHLSKLFQPFTQVDPSATRKYGGTGLGLAITKRFCQMMGGDVSVESEVGKGSTFSIWLPTHCPTNPKRFSEPEI